jgi:thymidylate synthase
VSLAKDYQNPVKPPSLYINHGEYITSDGIVHIINELKLKQTSNRALLSLINQEDIIGSGDNPIPSFMVLQFSLEGEELYVTTYFRALEVANFLNVNLEEI